MAAASMMPQKRIYCKKINCHLTKWLTYLYSNRSLKRRNILKVLIHDLNEQDFALLRISENDFEVINANGPFAPCMGCFYAG
jgi:AAA+ ATPase superfamily predicted ATPase